MRAFSVLSAVLLFVVSTWAATITTPSIGTIWEASSPGQQVAWTFVATDPKNFSLALSNMQTYPNINIILKRNVLTADSNTTVNSPPTGWPTGAGFQINVVQENPTGIAILTQSQLFNITGTTTPFSSLSSTSTGNSPASTQTGSNGGKNDAVGLTVQTGFIAGLALVGALLA